MEDDRNFKEFNEPLLSDIREIQETKSLEIDEFNEHGTHDIDAVENFLQEALQEISDSTKKKVAEQHRMASSLITDATGAMTILQKNLLESRSILQIEHQQVKTKEEWFDSEKEKLFSDFVSGDSAQSLRIRFSVPYRCNFGNHLRVIGNVDTIGGWNVEKALRMDWTDGDLWIAEAELPIGHQVEYKYVVCDDDGNEWAWKPGGNFQIQVPESGQGSIRVNDAWDETHREVQIEMVKEKISDGVEKDMNFQNDTNGDDESLMLLAERAMKQLEQAVHTSMKLVEDSDPISPELLAADRLVAASQQRALAMAQISSDIKQSTDH